MARKKKSSQRGHGTTYQRGKIWWIRYWRDGKPFSESSFSEDYQDAFQLLSKRNAERPRSKSERPQDTTIASLLPLVEDDYKQKGLRSVRDVKARVRLHVVPFFGQILASKLTGADIRAYKEKRLSELAEKATVNRELAVLRRSFQLGLEHEPPMVSRIPKIEKFPKDQETIRTGFLEHEQYRALLTALPPELRMLLVYGYHTGIRRGELLSIRVDQVNWQEKQLTLHHGTTKNKQGRVLPIYGDMVPWTEMALADITQNYPSCQWLFHRGGHHILDFRTSWKNACEAAGVDARLFHDLRRCAVRNMEFAGIARTVARSITGHKTESTYLRYMIASARDIRDAGERLARFMGESSAEPLQQPLQGTPKNDGLKPS